MGGLARPPGLPPRLEPQVRAPRLRARARRRAWWRCDERRSGLPSSTRCGRGGRALREAGGAVARARVAHRADAHGGDLRQPGVAAAARRAQARRDHRRLLVRLRRGGHHVCAARARHVHDRRHAARAPRRARAPHGRRLHRRLPPLCCDVRTLRLGARRGWRASGARVPPRPRGRARQAHLRV